MKEHALSEETDPYLDLNEKVEQALAGIEALSDNLEKAASQADFNPSVMKTVVGVLRDLTKTLAALSARNPNITVEAPKLTMPAPNVSITTDTPKSWTMSIVKRDEMGRAEKFSIKAD